MGTPPKTVAYYTHVGTMSNKLIFQNYIVAFLDLVGQREALRRLLRVPTSPDDEHEFVERLQESLGKVLELRRDFASFFSDSRQRHLDLTAYPADIREAVQAAIQTQFTVSGLSDSIVITAPLDGDAEHCKAVSGVAMIILSVCYLATKTFAIGMVFRGGLDVGMGTNIESNEVYGPALARAYQLESEMAEYPRFVVGDKLLEFIEMVKNQEPKTKFGRLAQKKAASCRRMIVQDTDGRQVLDFLGTEVRTTLGERFPKEDVVKGRDFVESEHKRFQDSGMEKLASRYFRLLQYYLTRQ